MSLERYWYSNNLVSMLLAPLGWLYCGVSGARRWAYASGLLPMAKIDVPVLVVGNITVGGTGKTPLVIWLVERLRAAGWRPAVVSRGYGGTTRHWPQAVAADSDPLQVGDEPVLLARRCGCPVRVDPDRARAARMLVEEAACDIIVADDGLQHFALARDVEIAVVDGGRRFGNGRCLPAGPLRERVERLQEVDFIVTNGNAARLEYGMRLEGELAVALTRPGPGRPLAEFAQGPVHAVAGIGNPRRFFSHLRRFGLQLIEHPFADHHRFRPSDLDFGDRLPVLMTEKDAVKCAVFATSTHWQVPVSAVLDANLETRLLELLARRGATAQYPEPAGGSTSIQTEPTHTQPE